MRQRSQAQKANDTLLAEAEMLWRRFIDDHPPAPPLMWKILRDACDKFELSPVLLFEYVGKRARGPVRYIMSLINDPDKRPYINEGGQDYVRWVLGTLDMRTTTTKGSTPCATASIGEILGNMRRDQVGQ